MTSATIARIDRSAIHDGPGVRTVVFLKGCPLECAWCHSPETQEPRPQLAVYEERCIRCSTCLSVCPNGATSASHGKPRVDRNRCRVCGDCASACPAIAREVIGHTADVEEVVRAIERDLVFYQQSGGGVTLSGGEPLQQAAFSEELLRRCRQRRISTAVETCGLASRKALLAVATWTDLFLYDIKVIDEDRHRRLTGGSNRQILENLRTLAVNRVRVRIRFPLVPGLNDDEDNISALGRMAAALRLAEVDVLPYHRAGLAKYARLGRPTPAISEVVPPDRAKVEAVMISLRGFGLDVRLGGSR